MLTAVVLLTGMSLVAGSDVIARQDTPPGEPRPGWVADAACRRLYAALEAGDELAGILAQTGLPTRVEVAMREPRLSETLYCASRQPDAGPPDAAVILAVTVLSADQRQAWLIVGAADPHLTESHWRGWLVELGFDDVVAFEHGYMSWTADTAAADVQIVEIWSALREARAGR